MHLLFTGDLISLQERFIITVRENRARDPLAELTVLVPGQLVRTSLSRELVRQGCPHVNIRFRTVNELARAIAEPVLRREGVQVIGDVARDLFAKHAIEQARGKLDYFARIAEFRGFRTKLMSTLADLHGACLTPAMLREAAQELADSEFKPTTARKLRELADLWDSYSALLTERRLIDRAGVIEYAVDALRANGSNAHPLIVYALDDLTELERRFLHTLFRGRDTTAFLPYLNSPAFRFTEDLKDWFERAGFTHKPLPERIADPQMHSLVQRGAIEAEITPVDVALDLQDGSISMISAPESARECDEIVRELLFPPDDESHSAAVLTRSAATYTDLLRTSLRRADVEAYFHQCRSLGETPPGRALGKFLRMLDGKFRRHEVADFLLSAPLCVPASLQGHLAEIPAAEWNQFSLRAGVLGGESDWRNALDRLARELQWQTERADPEDETELRNLNSRLRSLSDFRLWLDILFDAVRAVRQSSTFVEAVTRVREGFSDFVYFDDQTEDVFRQLDQTALLDAAGIKPDVESIVSVFESALGSPAAREGRFQESEPTVATIAEARGVVFDTICLAAMNEGEFPHASSQDPLLLDFERETLQAAVNLGTYSTIVPILANRIDYERYLFAVSVRSARRRLILSYSRAGDGGRETSPSRFLLDTVSALHGRAADDDLLDRFLQNHAHSRRIAFHDSVPPERATSRMEYDLALVGEALHTRDFAPLARLSGDARFLRSVEAERCRYHTRDFTRFDGALENEPALAALQRVREARGGAMSATSLESYWDCPFRWFARTLLGLEKIEAAEPLTTLDPLTRGRLLHEILQHFYSEQRNRNTEKDGDALRIERIALEILERHASAHPVGPHMLWKREQRRLIELLHRFLEDEARREERFVPLQLEWRFGETPLPHDLGDGRAISLRGVIDRIDEGSDGMLRVLDYKSGKNNRGLRSDSLLRGRALQLHLYCIAVESLLGKPVARALYYYLGQSGNPRVELVDWRRELPQVNSILRVLVDGMATGNFFPYPDEKVCRTCDARAACGAGRLTYKASLATTRTRPFRSIREEAGDE